RQIRRQAKRAGSQGPRVGRHAAAGQQLLAVVRAVRAIGQRGGGDRQGVADAQRKELVGGVAAVVDLGGEGKRAAVAGRAGEVAASIQSDARRQRATGLRP